ncbi:MAG: mechanosensitive ion channel, partial [Lachnospiraceae bacterium]|nr:mechanosensitive ion channel [Lachnospiraceae bacterium]
HLEFDRAAGEEGEESKKDGEGFVLIPLPGNANRSLVFEFSCEDMVELKYSLDSWGGWFQRSFISENITAFVKTEDSLTGYPMDGFTAEERSRIYEDVEKVFSKNSSSGNESSVSKSSIVTLGGKRYISKILHFSQDNTDIMLTMPISDVFRNGIFIAAAISAIILWGIVLLQIYIYHRLRGETAEDGEKQISQKRVFKATWPGIVIVIAVTLVFSSMLIMLENRTIATYTAISKRADVQYTIEAGKSWEDKTRDGITDFYRNSAKVIAAYLTEHPEYQTREGLDELNRIASSEYLMRFDSSGQEIVSSNSYTGFTVGKNLSEEYQAVLLGYPDIVVGPETDPYSGLMQLGIAVLMTDKEGKPDGFLLTVYSAVDMAKEMAYLSYEKQINSYNVHNGHVVAAVNDEDGRFIAHSDPEMIGQKAENYLSGYVPGNSYGGYMLYNGKGMYVSASSSDGKTLIYMVPEKGGSNMRGAYIIMFLIVLVILGLVYYPIVSWLIANEARDGDDDEQKAASRKAPVMLFWDGYIIFMTAFAIVTLIGTSNGWWTSFDYVLGLQWAKGIHLFSIWASLLVVAVVFCIKFVVCKVLERVESRLTIRGKTVTRLINSLTIYVAAIFLVFFILEMFGANTTTMLASAGVISIAVGMGAQSMAADLLAGFFLMLDGSVRVGDEVSVNSVKGHVTDMGIRTTEITDEDGNVVSLNNSKVSAVCNMSKKSMEPPECDGQ